MDYGKVNYYGKRDEFSRGSVSLQNRVDTGCYTVDVSSYLRYSELRGIRVKSDFVAK